MPIRCFGRLRGRGLMVALELKDTPEAAFTARVQRELVRSGFILAQRPALNVLRMDPCLTIEEQVLKRFLQVLEELLK